MIKSLSGLALFGFLSTFFLFAFQLVVSRFLNSSDYGIFAKWLTDVGYFGFLFILGLDSSLIFFSKSDHEVNSNLTKNAIVYFCILIFSLIFAALIDGLSLYYATLSITIFSLALLSAVRSVFQFKQKFVIFNYLLIFHPAFVLFFGVYVLIYNHKIDVSELTLFYSASVFVSMVISVLMLMKFEGFYFVWNLNGILNYMKFGFRNILNKFLSMTLYACTVYMISFTGNSEILGSFFLASSISKLVWILPDSAGNLLFPKFVILLKDNLQREVFESMFKVGRVVLFLNVVVIVVFLLIGNWILALLVSRSYGDLFFPIIILFVGNLGMVYFKLISRYLAAMDNWSPLYLSLLFAIIANVVLNYLLLPEYGIYGACWATVVSFFVCGLFISKYVKNSLFEFVNFSKLSKLN